MSKNLEGKVDELNSLTKSQQDRLAFKEQVFDDLITFLRTHIKKINCKNTLKERIETVLLEKLDSENPEDALTNFELIKLHEILTRSEVDSTSALIKAISESSKSNSNQDKPAGSEIPERKQEEASQEDITKSRKIMETLDKIAKLFDKTEFSKKEGENQK